MTGERERYAVVIRRNDRYVVYEKDEWISWSEMPGSNRKHTVEWSEHWPLEVASFVDVEVAIEYAASREQRITSESIADRDAMWDRSGRYD